MSETLARVRDLVAKGLFRVSAHAYDEIVEDGIVPIDVVRGVATAEVIENYPDAWKGPSVLVLQVLPGGIPVHALWGLPKVEESVTVLVTCYKPDPTRWSPDLRTRRPK